MQDSMRAQPDECAKTRLTVKLPDVLDKASLLLMEVPETLMPQLRQIVCPHVALESPIWTDDRT